MMFNKGLPLFQGSHFQVMFGSNPTLVIGMASLQATNESCSDCCQLEFLQLSRAPNSHPSQEIYLDYQYYCHKNLESLPTSALKISVEVKIKMV